MPRDWADAEYSRIYHTVVEDDKFAEVYDDDRRWAAYTRLLMAAESAYPSPAPLPRWLADDVLEHLASVRIIEVVRGTSYRIVGLKAEREGRLNGNQVGGKARAEKAERDEHGRFLPAPDAGASDEPAKPSVAQRSTSGAGTSASQRTSVAEPRRDEIQPRRDSLSGGSRARGEPPDVVALRDRGWKRVTAKQRAVLDEIAERHDETGHAFAAEAIRNAGPDADPLEAAMAADRAWQDSQRRRIEAEEASWQATKDQDAADAKRAMGRIDSELEAWTR
jgi:hypothetical protein